MYEFRKVTDAELDTRTVLRGLDSWAAQFSEDGALPPDEAISGGQPRNWREVPMGELRAVRDAMKNIETVARRQLKATLGYQKMEMQQEAGLLDAVARGANAQHRTPRAGERPPVTERIGSGIQGIHSYMQKMEWFIDQLDGGKIDGPARRNIKQPIDDAAGREKQILHDVHAKLAEAFKDMSLADKAREYDSVGVQFPTMDRPMNRLQLFSWALNLGTKENQKVALLGEGLINLDGSVSPLVGEALGKLSKAEAERIQAVWDALEEMRPKIIERERQRTGVEPKWKELTPFVIHTSDGHDVAMRGGYYPLRADRNISTVGMVQEIPLVHEGTFTRPGTSHSHTEKVTGATYALSLDYPSVLGQHLTSVVKDVAAGEAISYVSKFIMRQDVQKTLRETLGPEKAKEFLPWLQSYAQNGIDGTDSGPIVRWFMSRRSAVVVARLAGNIASYAVQLGDVFKPVQEVSPVALGRAFFDIRMNPAKVIGEIREKSPNEMRFREKNFNRDLRDILESKPILEAGKQHVSDYLLRGFEVMDRFTSFPAWLAKYREGIGAHGDESKAVREADRLIARTMQAGEPRNMSRMMRSQGMMRLFTTFGGDASTWYGIVSSSLGSKNLRRSSVALMALFTEQIVANMIRGRIPQDDKEGAWLLENLFGAAMNPLGVFGDFASFAVKKASGQYAKPNNPTLDAIEKALTVPFNVNAYREGRKDGEELAIDLVEAVGLWTGIPGTGQIVKSWKYQHGLQTGKQPPPSGPVAEAYRTLMGPPPKER